MKDSDTGAVRNVAANSPGNANLPYDASHTREVKMETSLVDRLERLEKSYTLMRRFVIAVALTSAMVFFIAAKPGARPPIGAAEVRTHRVVIVDSTGKEVGFFGVDGEDSDLKVSLGDEFSGDDSRFYVILKNLGTKNSRAEFGLDDMKKKALYRMRDARIWVFDPKTRKAATLSPNGGANVEIVKEPELTVTDVPAQ